MRPTPILAIVTALAVLGAVGVAAQQNEHMGMPLDTRQPLDFPAHMRKHMLMNMRSHLEALGEILASLGEGDGVKAGKIAQDRLGLESPAAAACLKPGASVESARASPMSDMAAMMAEHMPPHMREMGFAMHESASAFAAEAAKMPQGGDPKPALKALAQVTQNCAGCHSAYRLR